MRRFWFLLLLVCAQQSIATSIAEAAKQFGQHDDSVLSVTLAPALKAALA